MTPRTRRRLIAGGLLLLAAGLLAAVVPPPGPRSLTGFDPGRTAQLEVGMWQAYYTKQRLDLFRLLVVQLREQYRYSWARAAQNAFHLARAAATFAELRDHYEQVLPDLVRAYEITRDWTGARFDAAAVARAELGWWVARRTPGESQPEQVGRRIAEEYAILYGVPVDRVEHAGRLRAEAAAMRDAAGDRADWPAIAQLLDESYRRLHAAVQPGR